MKIKKKKKTTFKCIFSGKEFGPIDVRSFCISLEDNSYSFMITANIGDTKLKTLWNILNDIYNFKDSGKAKGGKGSAIVKVDKKVLNFTGIFFTDIHFGYIDIPSEDVDISFKCTFEELI